MKTARKPRSRAESLRNAKAAFLHPQDLQDPFAGVAPGLMRVLLTRDGADGKKHRLPRSWHWAPSPNGHDGADQEIHVRGDGWTSAHAGTIGPEQEPADERLIRCARLTFEEAEVFRLQLAGVSNPDIGPKLGITYWQVERRVKTGHAKLRAYAAVVLALGKGNAA